MNIFSCKAPPSLPLTAMYQLPKSFLECSQQPPDFEIFFHSEKCATDNLGAFFAQSPIASVYKDAIGKPHVNEILQAIATLLPWIHPYRSAQLAFLCGALVENGAPPDIVFSACCNLLRSLIEQVLPYCANAVDTDELKEAQEKNDSVHTQELLTQQNQWQQAQQQRTALEPHPQLELISLQHAIDILVPPIMGMLMRSEVNLHTFCEQHDLLAHIENIADNVTLPFDNLHFLHKAADLTYGEFVVILPVSQTGFVAKAHGINNVFHALTLLQDLMATHADALQIGAVQPSLRHSEHAMHTRYNWYNAQAFEEGQLVYPMSLAWGEAPLRHMPQKLGDVVLYAVESLDIAPRRGWDEGFCRILHSAQTPNIQFVRILHAHEVQGYLL